jgi:hypothetical protein
MLKSDLKPVTRKWAIALIIINLVRAGGCFAVYFQTEYSLVSPLIPKTIILDIIRPYMVVGVISTIVTIVAFIFFVYAKFTFTIITCLLSLALVQLYLIYLPFTN